MAWAYRLVPEELDRLRKEHGYRSDSALARKMDMAFQTVSKIRNGSSPSSQFMATTEALFGDITNLYELVEVPNA